MSGKNLYGISNGLARVGRGLHCDCHAASFELARLNLEATYEYRKIGTSPYERSYVAGSQKIRHQCNSGSRSVTEILFAVKFELERLHSVTNDQERDGCTVRLETAQ